MRRGVRKKLIEVARRGETITYGELMKEFRISRAGIGDVLRKIAKHEHSKGRPLLTVTVVRANSGRPGGGFFGLDGIPAHLKRPSSACQNPTLTIDEQEFVKEEQEEVWNYWSTHRDIDDP